MVTKNTLYTGDCLHIMHGIDSDSVDLIYLDPPFNSQRRFDAPIGSKAAGASFDDMWNWKDVDEQYLEELIENYPFLVQFIQTIGVLHSKSMKSYITYMAQRLVEMKRILKPNGSFYLHCDTTASHYLKIVCDRVFGKNNFKNDIIWQRSKAHSLSSNHYERVSDNILFYALGDYTWNRIYIDHDEAYLKTFKKSDKNGPYITQPLHGGKKGGPDAYKKWKGNLPTPGRAWAPPPQKSFPEDINFPTNYKNMPILKKLDVLDELGLIEWSTKGNPRYKNYLKASKGKSSTDIILDINHLSSKSMEKTGYPTQKPLDLIKRFIMASSNEGDIVLDPFCGCATTCVAAQQLKRKWIGIDISEASAKLVIDRLSDDTSLFDKFIHLTKPKKRSDLESVATSDDLRKKIYDQQNHKCNACEIEMDLRHFELDHIIPRAKGGGDYYDNFQLLCSSCNRIKGDRPMAYLMLKIEKINKALKFKVSFESGEE